MGTRLSTGTRVVRCLTEGRVTLNIEALGVVVVLEVLEHERGLVRGLGDDVGVPVYFTSAEYMEVVDIWGIFINDKYTWKSVNMIYILPILMEPRTQM